MTVLRLLPAVIALMALMAPAAHAATFTVNATNDAADAAPGNQVCATAGGTCTVRAALQESNALPGADTVVIPAGNYTIAASLPVSSTITIDGPAGARATVLDGAPGARVIAVSGGGSMTYSGITLTGGNGGMTVDNADVTLDRVAIRDNLAVGAGQTEGGGVFLSSGSLTITNSTLSGNIARSTGSDAIGGAISTGSSTTLTISNTTIAANRAEATSGHSAYGGGLSLRPTTTTVLRHVTLIGNGAGGGGSENGGNVYRQLASSALTVADTIIADGSANNGANCVGGGGSITTLGRNIDSGTTCGFGAGQLSTTAPLLEALADRGGPTDTRPPSTASPARDAAASCDPGTTDQRGAPRPSGAACDIGAAELGADLAVTITASRESVPAGGDVTYLARVTNTGFDTAPASTLDVALGAGAELVLASPSAGSCTGAHCDLGLLASGASVTVTLVVRAPATGPLTVSASTGSGHPDPDGSDNAAAVNTTVVAATGPGATVDTVRPTLGVLKAVGKVSRGRAATISTTLSEPARLSVVVERLIPGRKVGKACKTKARRGKRCTLARRVGTVTVTVAAGAVRFKLPAKIAGRWLARGRHRLTVVAQDAAGNRSAARTLTVTVVR